MSVGSRLRYKLRLRARHGELLDKARAEFDAGRCLAPGEAREFAELARRLCEIELWLAGRAQDGKPTVGDAA